MFSSTIYDFSFSIQLLDCYESNTSFFSFTTSQLGKVCVGDIIDEL